MLRYTYTACLVHIETRGTYTYHGVSNVNKIAPSADYCYSTFKFLDNHQTIRATDIISPLTQCSPKPTDQYEPRLTVPKNTTHFIQNSAFGHNY